MKLYKMLVMALCLALVACAALQAAAPGVAYAAKSSVISADATELKLVKGESKDVTLTFTLHNVKLKVNWDNSKVVTCKMSDKWDGDKTTMTVKAKGTGKAVIRLTNEKTKDVLKIKVTVVKKNAKQDIRTLVGKTVKSANKELADELKYSKIGYDNGSFRVGRDSLKRIKKIILYGGKGKYRLYSVYPGMKAATAVKTLEKQGWKLAKTSAKGGIYLNSGDPVHAIQLKEKSSKLAQVIYYVP